MFLGVFEVCMPVLIIRNANTYELGAKEGLWPLEVTMV